MPMECISGSLDLLVIDEAGQFCLANTIAVAPAANNLLLLGDPQQLPQVSQGTHPEPVDTSALDWLVDGQRTLPDERGYFLDRWYRMHPAVCAAVSALSYEGRLHSVTHVTAARHLDGCQPGVQGWISFAHQGNSIESPQEADAITAHIKRLLGASWTDEHGTRGADAPATCWWSRRTTPRWCCCAACSTRPVCTRCRPARSTSSRAAGAGGVHLDGGLLDRRGAARNLVPAQPESAQRGGEPGPVRRGDRALWRC